MFEIIVIGILFLASVVAGLLLNKFIKKKADYSARPFLLSLSRSIFFTPTLLVAGHGGIPATTIVAVPLQLYYEPNAFGSLHIVLPSLVFVISYILESGPKID